MNKNRIRRPTRCDELAQHSEVAGSVAEVNAAVVPGSNALLPGEIPTGQRGREVSRGHSSRGNEPGAGRCPYKQGHRKT